MTTEAETGPTQPQPRGCPELPAAAGGRRAPPQGECGPVTPRFGLGLRNRELPTSPWSLVLFTAAVLSLFSPCTPGCPIPLYLQELAQTHVP